MNRIVIVARTRMQHDHICIGGYDFDAEFRSVRLLDWFGDHFRSDSLFQVGELWDIRYARKESARPPHVEDVIVSESCRVGQAPNLKALVQQHVRPWAGGPDALFDGTVHTTPSGASYIPIKGRLPRCSTGYWKPDRDLVRRPLGERIRFVYEGEGAARRFAWVGTQKPTEHIEAGTLVRVSLSRRFSSETAPEGYYVQISGVL